MGSSQLAAQLLQRRGRPIGKMPVRKKTSRVRRPAKVTRQPALRGQMRGPQAPNPNLVHEICSLTDPFCPAAWGGKYPDGATSRSISWTAESIITLTTNATGAAALIIIPQWAYDVASPTTITGTVASGNVPASRMVFPAAARTRLVSVGVEINSVVAPLSASGTVYLRTFSPQNYQSMQTVDLATVMADTHYEQPLNGTRNLHFVPARLGTEALLFGDGSVLSSITTMESVGFQCGTIAVIGAPATTPVLTLRVVYHWEYVPADGDTNYSFTTPTPRPNVDVIQTSNNIFRRVGNYIGAGIEKAIHSEAARMVAGGAVRLAGAAIGARLGGPSGASTGYAIADRSYAMIVD